MGPYEGGSLAETWRWKSNAIDSFVIRGIVSPLQRVETHPLRLFINTWPSLSCGHKIHPRKNNQVLSVFVGVFAHGECHHTTHSHSRGPWSILTPLCKFCTDLYWTNLKFQRWTNMVISMPWNHDRGVPLLETCHPISNAIDGLAIWGMVYPLQPVATHPGAIKAHMTYFVLGALNP